MDNEVGPQWRCGQKSKLKRALLNLKLNKSIQKRTKTTVEGKKQYKPNT